MVAFLILQMVVVHDAIDWSRVDSKKGLISWMGSSENRL
jgi:hypothetical protein